MKIPRSAAAHVRLPITLLIAAYPVHAFAAWLVNGNPVCVADANQVGTSIASDGYNGAIVVWQDQRNTASLTAVYAQRVDAAGGMLWTSNGVALCTKAGVQFVRDIASDGQGGAIVVWEDWGTSEDDSSDVYAQRVDGSGNVVWSIDGVALCTASNYQYDPRVISDGTGGAIVTWRDLRLGNNIDVYAQRIDASGVPQWTVDGVLVCAAPGTQNRPVLTSDGAGGAIIVWQDGRSGNAVYAQRLDPLGNALWVTDGVALCAFGGVTIDVIADGAGGAMAAWSDTRVFGNADIYTQRIDALGNVLWTVDGVPICTSTGSQTVPQLASDGTGGAVMAWEDGRVGPPDIYAQRVDGAGNPLWTSNGVGVCTATDTQNAPQIVGDGSGGAVATWYDRRAGLGQFNIYAQQINAAGNPVCSLNGTPVCLAAGDQLLPAAVMGAAGAIVSWHDRRSGSWDVYAREVVLCETPVPVAFTSVIAFQVEDVVVVEWTTTFDEAFDEFRVYRSNGSGSFLDMGARISSARRATYRDETVEPGYTYRYQIGAIHHDGSQVLSPEVTVQLEVPALALHQNYPNPFHPTTMVSFSLPREAPVEIAIYAPDGALVRRLYAGRGSAGRNEVAWDGTDANGAAVSAGMYFCRLQTNGRTLTRKLTLVR